MDLRDQLRALSLICMKTVWKQGIQNVFSVNVEAPVNC